MISRFAGLSPASGAVLGQEPASDSVSPSLSAPFPAHALYLSLKINITKKKKIDFLKQRRLDHDKGFKTTLLNIEMKRNLEPGEAKWLAQWD